MCYQRITLPLRYKIEALYEVGHSCAQIATQLGVHRTTIGRELERCTP
ncbi:helix-turn-helix domain-containing protein, partial [Deinococcus sp.]